MRIENRISNKIKRLLCCFAFFWVGVGVAQNSALSNFDALWELFDKNYASFEEKGIDWVAVKETYRPKINPNTSELELYEIFKAMLKPLDDGHVTLRAQSLDSAFSASRKSRIIKELGPIPAKERRPRFYQMIDSTLSRYGFSNLKEIGPEFRNEKLFAYSKNGKVGYLRYSRSFSKPSNMTASLKKYLDVIFDEFDGLEAMVIDVRFNIGGDDAFSQTLAGCFIEEKQVAFYKQTRRNYEFGPLKSKYIEPERDNPFKGKVAVLTNDRTVSAADVFAMIMAHLPQMTLFGEPSNGSYSDLSSRKLPNGWKVTLSNQRYLDLEMKNYEGKGTPVDVEILNTLEDVNTGNDSVLVGALDFLIEK